MMTSPSDAPRNARERQLAILSRLKQAGTITVQELADTFSCSLATIRRDIHELMMREPQIRRYHGAVGLDIQDTEQWFHDKTALFPEEKDDLAALVVEWLPEGAVIGLNGGTTTTRVATQLAKNPKALTVVTNAINIAYQLTQAEIPVVVIGGDLRPYNYETTGSMALQGLTGLHLDWAILGANGVHPRVGITTTASDEAVLGQGFRRAADHVLIIADHSKMQRNALYRMLAWNDIDYVATGCQAASLLKEWPVMPHPTMNAAQTVGIWQTVALEDHT
ncbi:transcriptional regulator, DeoR family [Sulfobacillus thermosulfidooxidans DSM 9293]|uniref:Transcriptional regulator, DeoR family n=1 Tax=Sulfobacillus thermosulfidooxidans (strain DSM 9293 / VKM B-1269 / AT-1) TaxID=929705 RepID=A0A1W1WPS5_SULTA|nr:DeoR/GlpR family DNA-binding transcription regulator [Sulfobacillus thermosulfidooxidans]SMC08236.1 transcriptional regulator, DeoR family [Sulfobacillus thermosulfidooxidans DSM 9293]